MARRSQPKPSRAGRSLVLWAGLIGVVEQEVVRLALHLEPSSLMLALFGGFVMGAPAAEALDRAMNRDRPNDQEG